MFKLGTILFAALAAALTLSASSAVAEDLDLEVVSETNTTITFKYNAVPDAEGYRFYTGAYENEVPKFNPVSRTFDPTRTTVKFAKGPEAFRVTAMDVTERADGYSFLARAQCNDKIDNDGDGLIDYPADPGCSRKNDNDESNPPPADTTPPTAPTGLSSTSVAKTSFTLNWNASTDNVGVTGYTVYSGGVQSGTTEASVRTFDFSGLNCGINYSVGVSAKDAAGNQSPITTLNVSTNACTNPSANVFVSPSGNDSAACTQSAPCKSLQRGLNVATAGQVVQVAAGNYSTQSVSNVHKSVTLAAAPGASPRVNGQLTFTCTTGLTVDNIDAEQLVVSTGSNNFYLKNGEYGNGSYSSGNEKDPVVIGDAGSCNQGDLSKNVTLDNVYIHDYFWHQNPGSAHTDCLQFFGGNDGVVIKNSRFERCAESFIGAFPDFGYLKNIVIEDTTFTDISETGKGTYFASQWGCSNHPYASQSTGITIRRTTWTPNALGLEGEGISLRSDCAGFLVENNTFQYGPQQFACTQWDNNWNGTVTWRNNTFLNGGACTV